MIKQTSQQLPFPPVFNNKTLLITGGTGSFGGAVLKRFLNEDIGEIRIFSRDENIIIPNLNFILVMFVIIKAY